MTDPRMPFPNSGCHSSDPLRSISHYACPAEIGIERFLDRVAAAGFNAVALTGRSFEEMPIDRLRNALERRDLKVSSVNSAGYFLHADPARHAAQDAENTRLINLAATVGTHGLNVIAGGIGQDSSRHRPADARRQVAAALRDLAGRAQAANVPLLVEPIHPAGIHDKGCLNTIAQVRRAIDGLGTVRMTIDLYHSWWDPDLDATLGDPLAPVGLIQIADAGLDGGGAAVVRAMPGRGLVDIAGIIDRAVGTHPGTPLEFELFADRMSTAGTDAEDLLDHILTAAGAFLLAQPTEAPRS